MKGKGGVLKHAPLKPLFNKSIDFLLKQGKGALVPLYFKGALLCPF
jgi:hypothetical protein